MSSIAVSQSARLLLVEDSEDDAELILRALQRAGFQVAWRRVDTAAELREALTQSSWDAVIADYSMPAFSGLDALAQVKAIQPGLPFILASAVIGEERAVEAMRAGAQDYVMKRNLTRLPLVLARELREVEERRERRRAEDVLRRQTQFIATLTSSLGDGVFAIDAEGRLTFVNAAAERLVAWRAEDLLGQDLHGLLHSEHLNGASCPIAAILRSGQPFRAEEDLFRRKDGSVLPVSFTASPLRDGEGIVGAVLVFQDISERKRAERATGFLCRASASFAESLDLEPTLTRIAAVSVPELADFCAVDVLETNDGGMRQSTASASGAPSPSRRFEPGPSSPWVGQVIHENAPVLEREAPPEFFSSSAWTADERTSLEALRPASYLCVPMRADGSVVGALCLVTALGHRSLDTSDLELAQRLSDRAAMAIAHARLYREAQDAVRARDDFLSIASHELRTPLTPLQLHMQRLRTSAREGKLVDMPAEQLAKTLDMAVRLVERLAHEVTNLLDVSRICGGRITVEPEEFDLVALVREVSERAEPELARAECKLDLKAEAPVVGHWDRLRIERSVSNLLSNAIKYGAGKPIELSVSADAAASEARLSVRDHGIGIAADRVERIFGRFERAASARTYGGLGLGLYIVRQFVEAHGGHVDVETTEGQGSTFTVRLPLGKEK